MIFLRIYVNPAGFRAPPLIEGCGLRFEGVGRMWEGTRTVGETRDEGDLSGASGKVSKRLYLPRFLIRNTRTHLFMSTDAFKSRRKMSCRRPQPISLTTTTQAGERCHFAAHLHPRLRQPHPPAPYLRNYDGAIGQTHRRQPC